MSTATDRRFIARRTGTTVTIREVDPGSCAFDFSKREAWDHAQREARPAKRANCKDRQAPAQIVFQGLDGMSTVVQTAQATQDAHEADTKPATKLSATPDKPKVETPAAPRFRYSEWAAQDPQNERVATYLRTQDGKLNDFEASLLGQLEQRGTLSDKQRDCIVRKLDKPTPEAPKSAGLNGRYAVDYNGKLRFYKVDSPTEGRWAGYTFVKVMASDEEHAIRNNVTRNEIIALIAADPQAAAIKYGQEIGRCCKCNRTLTDDESRAKGIGPECEKKL